MNKSFCERGAVPKEQDFWNVQIFLAQIEVVTFESDPKHRLDLNYLKQQSDQSKGRTKLWGRCPKEHLGWTLSAPAATSEVQFDAKAGLLSIDWPAILKSCRQASVEFAPLIIAQTTTLMQCDHEPCTDKISTKELGSGFIGVYCIEQKNRDLGSELLVLIPQQTASLAIKKQSIENWLDQLRRDDHARLLMKPSNEMTKVASALSEYFSIAHKPSKLLELSKSLKSSVLLGENRVIATHPQEAMEHLWRSPRHRKLLLNRDATHVAIARRIENGRTLFVMVFFKADT